MRALIWNQSFDFIEHPEISLYWFDHMVNMSLPGQNIFFVHTEVFRLSYMRCASSPIFILSYILGISLDVL